MEKNTYSFLLSPEIVQALDALAYLNDVDRSYMLNRILAEHLSVNAPEKGIKEIFDMIDTQISGMFKTYHRLPEKVIYIKSSLRHEYRPALKYSFKLYSGIGPKAGEFSAILRSHELNTLREFNGFIHIWIGLEEKFIHPYFPNSSIVYTVQNGRLSRALMYPKDERPITNEILSRAISDYIKVFDGILKMYINKAVKDSFEIEKEYLKYINKGIIF